MSLETLPTGPNPEAITRIVLERHPETVAATSMGVVFFSLDETHWPNFATMVTTDEHDDGTPSNLTARPGVFRLNIGVGRSTFERLVGSQPNTDYAAFDIVLPHPVGLLTSAPTLRPRSRESAEPAPRPGASA